MSERRFDPIYIFRRLRAHGVRFVLVGGMAAAAAYGIVAALERE